MGRSITPRYRVEFQAHHCLISHSIWQVKTNNVGIPGNGKPTDKNLARYIRELEDSTKTGGVNAHLGPMLILSARIVDQFTDEVKASYDGLTKPFQKV